MNDMPKQTLWLLQQFENADYSCYFVGGCVRDFLLKRTIHDYDFTTNATPAQMIALFQHQDCKILDIGAAFGTITVIYQGLRMEITTYRIEQEYQKHRSPKQIAFSDTICDDLSRRDFTVNAIAYHPKQGFIDPFDGQSDIKNRVLRCVGSSQKRLNEDALRILRALRFHFTLGFTIEKELAAAIIHNAPLLSTLSKERIQAEFQEMLMSDADNLLQTLRSYQVLEYIVPFIKDIYDISQESKWHSYDVFTHTDIALNHTKGYTLTEKLAVLFHDFGKPFTKRIDAQGIAHFPKHQLKSREIAKEALCEMKYPKHIITECCTLIALHDDYIKPDELSLRKLLAELSMNYELAFSLIRIQAADAYAKNPLYNQAQLTELKQAEIMLSQMKATGFSVLLKDLKLNGNDLKQLGYFGSEIKTALHRLYDKVIENPSCNDKKQLLEILKQFKSM